MTLTTARLFVTQAENERISVWQRKKNMNGNVCRRARRKRFNESV